MNKQNADAKAQAKTQASKVTLTIADHNREELDELRNYKNLVGTYFSDSSTQKINKKLNYEYFHR